jgi:hypothetical protein
MIDKWFRGFELAGCWPRIHFDRLCQVLIVLQFVLCRGSAPTVLPDTIRCWFQIALRCHEAVERRWRDPQGLTDRTENKDTNVIRPVAMALRPARICRPHKTA